MGDNRRKRGKVLSVSLDEQKIQFIKYREQLADLNNLPPTTSKIFQDISRQLSFRMSVKALYLSLKRNYHHFFDNNVSTSSEAINSSQSSSTTEKKFSSNSNAEDNIQTVLFDVDSCTWDQIKPVIYYSARHDKNKPNVKYQKRPNLPKHKWTNIMSELLWKHTKRRCTWVFKNRYATQDNFIKFSGHCKQCGATINAHTTAASEKSASFECQIADGDINIVHDPKLKNKITKFKKDQLSDELKKEYPAVVRRKIINNTMDDTDNYEPPFIPSLKSLEDIRYKSKSNTFFHQILIVSLALMHITPPFNDAIKTFSVSPWTYRKNTTS